MDKTTVNELLPNLYCIWPDQEAGPRKPAYLAVRPGGNLLFGHGGPVVDAYEQIRALGGLKANLVGDRHHIKEYPRVAQDFGIPVACSAEEARAAKRKRVVVDEVIAFERHFLYPDLEVIPTPGHTSGALSYLLGLGDRRILLVGDTICSVDGEWVSYVSRRGLETMRETLATLATLDFNYLAVDSFVCTEWLIKLDKRARAAMIRALSGET